MKAISLWQPWASLVAAGVKPFETRSWAPPAAMIGQRIAIHAAKKSDKQAAAFATDLMYGQIGEDGFALAERLEASWGEDCTDELSARFGECVMPAGCIVCTAKIEAAYRLPDPAVKLDLWGDYTPGRYAWRLTEVQCLKPPLLMTGRQGWWELPQGWMVP